METSFGRHLEHCSKAASTFLPAAREATWYRSGKDSQIERVLCPIDPVEPRMASVFTSLYFLRIACG